MKEAWTLEVILVINLKFHPLRHLLHPTTPALIDSIPTKMQSITVHPLESNHTIVFFDFYLIDVIRMTSPAGNVQFAAIKVTMRI